MFLFYQKIKIVFKARIFTKKLSNILCTNSHIAMYFNTPYNYTSEVLLCVFFVLILTPTFFGTVSVTTTKLAWRPLNCFLSLYFVFFKYHLCEVSSSSYYKFIWECAPISGTDSTRQEPEQSTPNCMKHVH